MFMETSFEQVLQIGLLLTSLFGVSAVVYQLRQNTRVKQSDNFLILSERYVTLKQSFYDAVTETGAVNHLTVDKVIKTKRLKDLPGNQEGVYRAARSLVSFYRTEYYLMRFGAISKTHWSLWTISFEEDAETAFWPDFWEQVRERYKGKKQFMKIMDGLFLKTTSVPLNVSPDTTLQESVSNNGEVQGD